MSPATHSPRKPEPATHDSPSPHCREEGAQARGAAPTRAAPEPSAAAARAGHQARHPGEVIQAGPVVLRRVRPEDACAMAAVVGDSLEHLQPWLPWATLDAADPGNQQARIAEAQQLWEAGSDYLYSVFAPDGTLAGSIGMHRRVGDGGMEIGYWISARAVGRGYATAAAAALTAEAKTLTGVERVEIHCDVANLASASIPRKLGYRMDRMEAHEPEAPGELGRRMIWVSDR